MFYNYSLLFYPVNAYICVRKFAKASVSYKGHMRFLAKTPQFPIEDTAVS